MIIMIATRERGSPADRSEDLLDIIEFANIPDDFPHEMGVHSQRHHQTRRDDSSMTCLASLNPFDSRQILPVRIYRSEDGQNQQGMFPDGGERGGGEMCENEESDVVSKGETPEEDERDQEGRM